MSVIWGLDLSATAVRLMRRDGEAWHEEGREPLDGDAMEDRLKALADRMGKPRDATVFLPADQVLYTTLELADLSNARAEIEAAMDGRTPYALSEIRLDWDIQDDNTAYVAAVAVETLDEATTFVRGLGVRPTQFSTAADAKDFPREPAFGTLEEAPPLVLTDSEAPAPTFVSARAKSEPRTDVAAPGATAPVVTVDDATPVMQVDAPTAPVERDPAPAIPGP
ncbi:MAG: hypothetical protein AAF762_10980, partial [Pseudomonadota bacterium]